jgi:organic radical activating enzyme
MIYLSLNDLQKTIFIEFITTSKCNYKCSYCSAKYRFKESKFNDYGRFKMFETYINQFKTIKENNPEYKIRVRILGGEPTLYPYLNDLLNILNNNPYVDGITLFSNCSHSIPNFNSETKKNFLVFSVHFEYARFFNRSFKNIINSQNHNVVCSCVCNSHNSHLEFIIQNVKKYNFEFHLSPCYTQDLQRSKLIQSFIDFKKTHEYIYSRYKLMDYYKKCVPNYFETYITDYFLHPSKGNCILTEFEIDENGKINTPQCCKQQNLSIDNIKPISNSCKDIISCCFEYFYYRR